jgi:iron complex transport system substrate-binding protein
MSDRNSPAPMRPLLAIGVTAIALSALAHAADSAPNPTRSKPTRIVSMNLCTDELVLRLADVKNIASVTWLSRSPITSNVSELSALVPINHGLAEEIIPQNPDLVLAGTFTTRTAVALLKRTGVPLREVPIAASLDEVRRQYRDFADLLGERERGERIVAELDDRLAKLAGKLAAEPPSVRPRAVVLNPNGVTVGEGTLTNDIMTRAGLRNVAAHLKIDNYNQLALETIVTEGVEILIVSAARDGPPAMATEVLKHPVIAQISDRTKLVVMPTRMWTCPGPSVVDAIELLMRAAQDVRDKKDVRDKVWRK